MTVQMYQEKAKAHDPQIFDIPSFMKEFFPPECASIVDIYCDPPFDGWRDMAAHTNLPLKYHFAMGCHPHNAKRYDDSVEAIILEAMKHPYCTSFGSLGSD
jgi:TatD DNase family protein